MRRAAPERRSGIPFLIAMASLVLAAGLGAVARFSPEDLGGGAAKTGLAANAMAMPDEARPAAPEDRAAPLVAPAPATTSAPAVVKKRTAPRKTRRLPGSRLPVSTTKGPDVPDNPYGTI